MVLANTALNVNKENRILYFNPFWNIHNNNAAASGDAPRGR